MNMINITNEELIKFGKAVNEKWVLSIDKERVLKRKPGTNTGERVTIEKDSVFIDGVQLAEWEIIELAMKDGFDSVRDFFKFFEQKMPFIGQLIFWELVK